ncbi:MAG TPA: carbon monoxide dehydrogenase subunit G [Candidatus Nanopelagicaceae bacterium]|nr:carbon monoxide dehydrogenase subunit G [Candidatus Nanopelagicaceae bacterium]
MKIAGTASIGQPPERVFAALTDPAVLARTLPGCLSLQQIGPDAYKMVITAGVASIKGSYLGQVEISNRVEPSSFTMRAAGSGAPGTIQAEIQIKLVSDGEGTLLSYDADAAVGGVIAGVGQRVLSGVAKKTAGEFFKAMDRYLSGDFTSASPIADSAISAGPSMQHLSTPAPSQRLSSVQQNGSYFSLISGAGIALVGVIVGWLISR